MTIGQDFLSFQWDNLLLETAFFTLFVTPAGWRPKTPRAPAPVAIFLMQWLLFRLHVESGAAKLLGGDPTWRDLTAMVSYLARRVGRTLAVAPPRDDELGTHSGWHGICAVRGRVRAGERFPEAAVQEWRKFIAFVALYERR